MADDKIVTMTRMVYLESLVMCGFVTLAVGVSGFLALRDIAHARWFLAFLWIVAWFPMVGLWKLTFRARERWKLSTIRSVLYE